MRGATTEAVSPVSVDGSTVAPGVPLALVETVAAVPGVARVTPNLQGTAILAGSDGIAVRNGGAPSLGLAFPEDDPAFTLVSGRGPTGPGEVAVESGTLDRAHLEVGDRTRAVIGDRAQRVTITGEVRFGSLFGATAVLVDEVTAQAVPLLPDGTVSVTVGRRSVRSQPGARCATAVAGVLPARLEAVTGASLQSETETAVQQGLEFFTTFLLAFAGVALFVGSFIIVNTFSMLIGQRARELALLRALGATRAQVMRTVLGEAVVIGLVGLRSRHRLRTAVAAGAQAAIGKFLSTDIGSDLPLSATTVVLSVLVGVLVTIVAAVLPARRASQGRAGGRHARERRCRHRRPAPARTDRHRSAGSRSGGAWYRGLPSSRLLAGGGAGCRPRRARAPGGRAAGDPARRASHLVAVRRALGAAWAGSPARTRCASRAVPRPASALMIGLALVAGISVLAPSVKASVSEGSLRSS